MPGFWIAQCCGAIGGAALVFAEYLPALHHYAEKCCSHNGTVASAFGTGGTCNTATIWVTGLHRVAFVERWLGACGAEVNARSACTLHMPCVAR